MSINQIEHLNGSNFQQWKCDIELNLGILDFDHVLKEDPPLALAENASTYAKEKNDNWYKHNKMALIMIKKSMISSVRGSIPDSENCYEEYSFDIWVKDENGDDNHSCWTKHITIEPIVGLALPLTFWKSDEFLMVAPDGHIVSYNLDTQKYKHLPLHGIYPGYFEAVICVHSIA
ncbi:hypothetical protein ACLB2K_057224 [Fragaria x ananassa]